MRISDWSSDVCSSDLRPGHRRKTCRAQVRSYGILLAEARAQAGPASRNDDDQRQRDLRPRPAGLVRMAPGDHHPVRKPEQRSEEHTSELQSLMRISYAVFCLKKKTKNTKSIKIYAQSNHLTLIHNSIT